HVCNQPADPNRRGKQIRVGQELIAQKSLCTSLAHIADVNVLQKMIGDEIMFYLPRNVWCEDQQRESYGAPEPRGLKIFARTCQCNACKNSSYIENDGVLGQQPNSYNSANCNPPARIFRLKQANHEPRNQHPPQQVEG